MVDRLPSALGFGDRDGHRTDRDARPAHLAALVVGRGLRYVAGRGEVLQHDLNGLVLRFCIEVAGAEDRIFVAGQRGDPPADQLCALVACHRAHVVEVRVEIEELFFALPVAQFDPRTDAVVIGIPAS